MKLVVAILTLLAVALGINACGGSGGGGGGGGTGTITGIVVFVETGGAPNPRASVQVGGANVLTDSTDGSFTLTVPAGTTQVTVDTQSAAGVWTFTIPAVSGTEDVGSLWVGPQKVTLTGQVLDSSSNAPVVGANVSFGGAVGKTDANGIYSLNPVAYPTTNFAAFWGIIGNVTAANYFANTLSASPNTAVNGTVTAATVLLTPLSNTTPPPTPYTIWGRITPTANGAGCTVTLLKNGTTVGQTTADSSGTYYFWVPAGTYTLHFVNGAHTVPTDPTVTVKATNDVERQDVVLN